MLKVMLIFLGAGCGGLLRFAIGSLFRDWWKLGSGFPMGTLIVNVTGCLAMGVLATLLIGVREDVRAGVLVGVLGGYTTFSAFGHEAIVLAGQDAGGMGRATIYVMLSVVLGLGAVWVGVAIGRIVIG